MLSIKDFSKTDACEIYFETMRHMRFWGVLGTEAYITQARSQFVLHVISALQIEKATQ